MVGEDAAAVEDPSVARWLTFHDSHERLELGYRYIFGADELEVRRRGL
jgi:hypothetical protein